MSRSGSPHDAVIVGAGPAGLATALAAARCGLRPCVLDARRPPIDKACGEGLMPDGAAVLSALGVVVPTDHAAPFHGIRWIDGATVVNGSFPGAPGLGLRRTRLHAAMVEAAGRAGIRVDWGVTVRGLEPGLVRTDRGAYHARWIVGADGLRSTLRRLAGLEAPSVVPPRFGRCRHLAAVPWTDRVEVWWDDEGEAYLTPLGPDEIGIALLSGGRASRFEDLPRRFPGLARRLGDAPVLGPDRGAGPFAQRVGAVHAGRIALVGDAAGYLDAITGEGLSLAFHQALALAEAIRRDDPSAYAVAHRRIGAVPEAITRLVLVFSRRPGLRRRVLRALAGDKTLFERLLAVHVRELPLRRIGLLPILRLASGTFSKPAFRGHLSDPAPPQNAAPRSGTFSKAVF